MNTPKCYDCKYRRGLSGDAHSKCVKTTAKVKGDSYGKRKGWFSWPMNFDPTWLYECDGFEELLPANKETA